MATAKKKTEKKETVKKEPIIAPAAPKLTKEEIEASKPKNPNELTPEEAVEALTPNPPKEVDGTVENKADKKPSATQSIPAVEEKVKNPKLSSEDVVNDGSPTAPTEQELGFGTFDNDRSMKFTIDPDTIKAPSYATDDFREFVEKYRKKKGAKPNILFINTESLEKLGYRDVAVDLGLHIKESTVYKKKELVLALDL